MASPSKKEVSPPKHRELVPLRKRATSTKFILTAGSLLAVFFLVYTGKEVRQLEILVPAILLFYNGPNVTQDIMNKRTEKRES